MDTPFDLSDLAGALTRPPGDDHGAPLAVADDLAWLRTGIVNVAFLGHPDAGDRGYEHYQPAYRYGHDAARQHSGRQWDEVEGDLERGWHSVHGTSRGAWDEMKHAARDAWDHTRGDRPHAR